MALHIMANSFIKLCKPLDDKAVIDPVNPKRSELDSQLDGKDPDAGKI